MITLFILRLREASCFVGYGIFRTNGSDISGYDFTLVDLQKFTMRIVNVRGLQWSV